jgi:hypothetical protein
MSGAHRRGNSIPSWVQAETHLEDPVTAQSTQTPQPSTGKHRVDSEQGMMIVLAVIVAIAVIGVMLVGG